MSELRCQVHVTEGATLRRWNDREDQQVPVRGIAHGAGTSAAPAMKVPRSIMIGSSLQTHAPNDWVLGRNPFDVSLLIGSGHGDAAYMFFYAIRLPPH